MRESRTYGSVRAKAKWLSYSTLTLELWHGLGLSGVERGRRIGEEVDLGRPAGRR